MFELIAIIIIVYIVAGTLWLGVVLPAWEAWRRRP